MMGILFKRHTTGETVIIDYEEFKRRICEGKIVPEDQVKDRILSDDQWRSVDEVRIFHKLSPIQYPKGPLLKDREAVERWMWRRSEQESRRWRKEFETQQKRVRRFFGEKNVCLYSLAHNPLYEYLVSTGEPRLTREKFAVRFSYGVDNRKACNSIRRYNDVVCVTLRGDEWLLRCPLRTKTLSADSDDVRRLIELVDAVNRGEEREDQYGVSPGSLRYVTRIWTLEIARRRHYRLKSVCNPMDHTKERVLREFVALSRHLKKLARSDRPSAEIKP